MLIPLILGLLIKAHSPDTAKDWAPTMNKIGAWGNRDPAGGGVGIESS